jgi:hypothetical protein
MKKLMSIVIGFLILGTTSVLSQNSDELQGAWEIIYQKLTYPDTTLENTQFANPSVKILTKKHVAFGHQSSDGESISGGGGTYSYDGKTYIEHIKYHGYSSLVGKSIEFKSKLDGDKWTISGVIPGDGEKIHLKEIRKRIE